jgi:hypothetical protein
MVALRPLRHTVAVPVVSSVAIATAARSTLTHAVRTVRPRPPLALDITTAATPAAAAAAAAAAVAMIGVGSLGCPALVHGETMTPDSLRRMVVAAGGRRMMDRVTPVVGMGRGSTMPVPVVVPVFVPAGFRKQGSGFRGLGVRV